MQLSHHHKHHSQLSGENTDGNVSQRPILDKHRNSKCWNHPNRSMLNRKNIHTNVLALLNRAITQLLNPRALTKRKKSRLSKHMRSGSGEVPVVEGLHPISHWPHARSNRMLAREHYPKISSLLLRQLASRNERSRRLLRKRTLFPATPFDFCAFFKRSWAKNRFWSFIHKTSNHTGLPRWENSVISHLENTDSWEERSSHTFE